MGDLEEDVKWAAAAATDLGQFSGNLADLI